MIPQWLEIQRMACAEARRKGFKDPDTIDDLLQSVSLALVAEQERNRYSSGDIVRRAREIRSDSENWAAAELAGATLEPLAWLSESEAFGRLNVYTPEVLAAVEAAQRSGAEKVEVVDLPEAYLKAAGALAQKRAAFAAWRLAAILSEDLRQ